MDSSTSSQQIEILKQENEQLKQENEQLTNKLLYVKKSKKNNEYEESIKWGDGCRGWEKY